MDNVSFGGRVNIKYLMPLGQGPETSVIYNITLTGSVTMDLLHYKMTHQYKLSRGLYHVIKD